MKVRRLLYTYLLVIPAVAAGASGHDFVPETLYFPPIGIGLFTPVCFTSVGILGI